MRLLVGENYVWCLVVVVVFMRFGGVRKWGEALKLSHGVVTQATKGGSSFYGETGFSLCNTAVLELYGKFYWVL